MMGPSGGGGGYSGVYSLLEVITNPEEYKRKMDELHQAMANFQKAAGSKKRLDNAEQILLEAQQKEAKAKDVLVRAEVDARKSKESADEYYRNVTSDADVYAREAREKADALRLQWERRTDEIESRHNAIDQLEKDLNRKVAEADSKMVEARKIQTEYEEKLARLKNLVS